MSQAGPSGVSFSSDAPSSSPIQGLVLALLAARLVSGESWSRNGEAPAQPQLLGVLLMFMEAVSSLLTRLHPSLQICSSDWLSWKHLRGVGLSWTLPFLHHRKDRSPLPPNSHSPLSSWRGKPRQLVAIRLN